MSIWIINELFNRRIRRDDALKFELAKINKVKVGTIDRWLREDDVMLTTATNLSIIKKHFDVLEESEMLAESITA